MLESEVLAQVRLVASKMGYVLWRNNRGVAKDAVGNVIRYGLGPNGASDLIGYVPVTITPDMVGKQVAVFTAFEIKKKGGKVRPEQRAFVERVSERGGVGAVLFSSSEVPSPSLIGE